MWGRDVHWSDVTVTTLVLVVGWVMTESLFQMFAILGVYAIGFFMGLENQARVDKWYRGMPWKRSKKEEGSNRQAPL